MRNEDIVARDKIIIVNFFQNKISMTRLNLNQLLV